AGWTGLTCALIVLAYAGTVLQQEPPGRAFGDDLLVLTAISLLAAFITGARARARSRELAQAAALRESEVRMRTVVSNAPIVLFTVDRDGIVTASEGRGLARVGLVPGEIVGRSLVEHAPHLEALIGRALAVDGATFECRLAPMRDAGGTVTGAIGLAIDTTERTQADDARQALERKLLESQKLESLGALAGGVAHDFNNLLGTILGNASLALADLPPDTAARPSLQRIETAARRGTELT